MQVHLVRHGIAEGGHPGLSDAERALTQQGRRKLRAIFEAAAQAGVRPSLILASPLKRAVETADIAHRVLGYKHELIKTKALAPHSAPELVWNEIRDHRNESSIMLVGHNPLFAFLAGFLLGCPELQIDLKKGSIFRVDFDSIGSQPKGVLRWYLIPKLAAGCA